MVTMTYMMKDIIAVCTINLLYNTENGLIVIKEASYLYVNLN